MGRKKKQRKPSTHTPLAAHVKEGTRLVPPLAQLPMVSVSWDRDMLPEHLWIASLRDFVPLERLHEPFYAFMDAIDEIWDQVAPAIGLLTDFKGLEAYKDSFVRKHAALIHDVFLVPFGRILAFFPESPANWLVTENFLAEGGTLDPEVELGRLRNLVLDLFDNRGKLATAVRMAAFARILKNGKMFFQRGSRVAELLPKYPGDCSPDERAEAESHVRASLNAYLATTDRYNRREWPQYFWRHNYDLAPCRPRLLPITGSKAVTEEEFEALERAVAANARAGREYMGQLALRLRYDLYEPERGEILHGLFARCMRLYLLMSENPSLWARDIAGILLRCLVETAITFCYLAEKGSKEDFRRFREYGEGQKKLLMLHLQDAHPDSTSLEGRSSIDISEEIGGFSAELLQIELGHWAKKDARKLAEAVGLEKYYRLVFSPASADVHGTWASLKDSNLSICFEPLHRFHRLPAYAEPPLYIATLKAAQSLLKHVHTSAVSTLNYPEDLAFESLIQQDSMPE